MQVIRKCQSEKGEKKIKTYKSLAFTWTHFQGFFFSLAITVPQGTVELDLFMINNSCLLPHYPFIHYPIFHEVQLKKHIYFGSEAPLFTVFAISTVSNTHCSVINRQSCGLVHGIVVLAKIHPTLQTGASRNLHDKVVGFHHICRGLLIDTSVHYRPIWFAESKSPRYEPASLSGSQLAFCWYLTRPQIPSDWMEM